MTDPRDIARRSIAEENAAISWAATFEGELPSTRASLTFFLESAFMAGAYWARDGRPVVQPNPTTPGPGVILDALISARDELVRYIDFMHKHDYREYAAPVEAKVQAINTLLGTAK
jgi:hypothetical protein